MSLLAGCGGGENQDAKPPNPAALVDCLRGIRTATVSTKDADFIASAAGVVGVQVRFARNELNIAVERTEADARQTLESYGQFFDDPGEGQLQRTGTVVLAYNKTPTADEIKPVETCVSNSR